MFPIAYVLRADFLFDMAFDLGLHREVPFLAIEILDRALLRYLECLFCANSPRCSMLERQAPSDVALLTSMCLNMSHGMLVLSASCLQVASKIYDASAIITPKLLKTIMK
jgi:hypothetical protein